MPEKVSSEFYASVAAESMKPEMLNYLTALAKGMPKYDNADNEAVNTTTPPKGIESSPFYRVKDNDSAFDAIKLAAEGGHAASMMRMGDLTSKQRDGLPAPNQVKSVEWLTKAHEKLETTINNPDATAKQKADANWDMSAVHYYNSTLGENKADLKLPDGIKNPEEADLYYTTMSARFDTNHRYGEWVERVLEGTEYKMDASRKQEIMGMANSVEMHSPRIYGSGKENLGKNNAPTYPPYVSTAESRAELLEKIRDDKTNPADPVDEKFDDKMENKLERLEKIDPETKMSDLNAGLAALNYDAIKNVSQSPSSLAMLNERSSAGASLA